MPAHRNGIIFAVRFLFFVFLLQFSHCSSTEPKSAPRSTDSPKPKIIIPEPLPLYPPGWMDITAASRFTGMLYCLSSDSLSGFITLKEFFADKNSAAALAKENIQVLGNISLRLKIAERNSERRITRTPYLYGNDEQFSSFVYSDNGLLHRVVLFTKEEKIYESEVYQENLSANFNLLSEHQLIFIERFLNGRKGIEK
ncbi:MAG: hypothetical protein H3C35_12210 [Bacteroidetes bacterium]|nr:hypothetical protein [Bacteroidota bacterium]